MTRNVIISRYYVGVDPAWALRWSKEFNNSTDAFMYINQHRLYGALVFEYIKTFVVDDQELSPTDY